MNSIKKGIVIALVLTILFPFGSALAQATKKDESYLSIRVAVDTPSGIINKGPNTVLAKFILSADYSDVDVGVSLFEIGTTNLGSSLGKIKIEVTDKTFVTRFVEQDGANFLGYGGPFPLFIISKDTSVTMTLTADTTNIPDGSIFTFTVLNIWYQENGPFNSEISRKIIWARPTSDPIILGHPVETEQDGINSCSIIEQENSLLRENNNKLSILMIRLLDVIDYLQRWIAIISPHSQNNNKPSLSVSPMLI